MYRVDAVEQVFAERRPGHHFRQVPVGGGNEAYVDRYFPVASQACDLTVLEDCQQFGLQADRQVAYLVQEQGAAAGGFEFTGTAFAGIGKGAFLMPEQLAFKQRLTDGTHIHVDHFPSAAQGETVYFSGQHFFACPVLACDQDIRVCFSHFGDHLDQLHHNGRVPDDHGRFGWSGGGVLSDTLFVGFFPGGLQCGMYLVQQHVVVPRFEYEVCCSAFQGFHGQFHIPVSGQHDNRQAGYDFLYAAEPEQALVAGVDAGREVHVEDNEIDGHSIEY